MDRVYIVMGEAGEYSDYRSWPVRAFAAHAAALAFVEECKEAARTVPRQPSWDHRIPGDREAYDGRRQAYDAARLAWAASAPDPSCPDYDQPDYHAVELPFGRDSTALETAPARVRHGGGRRNYDLE